MRFKKQLLALGFFGFFEAVQALEPPPQYVLIAFDNCAENSRWQELSAFLTHLNSQASYPVHFTFFVSGVGLITDQSRHQYHGPGHRVGESNIDFGGKTSEVLERVQHINSLHSMGDEIASHAVGHFDGSHWSLNDWLTEFTTYASVLKNIFQINGFEEKYHAQAQLNFNADQIVGFRAPYLGKNRALDEALDHFHYRYDTSEDAEPGTWPQKKGGHWIFPLADLRIAGTGLKTLSMDYNFFVAQSRAVPDPVNASRFEEQMYQTYLNYFAHNYSGNRAPIHIGHHFFLYQNGAYNRALKRFAEKICPMKDVRCVSYRELADFLDRTSPVTRAAWAQTKFGQVKTAFRLLNVQIPRALDLNLRITTAGPEAFVAELTGEDAKNLKNTLFEWKLGNEVLSNADHLDPSLLREAQGLLILSLKNSRGVEVARSSREFFRGPQRDYRLAPAELEDGSLVPDSPEAHDPRWEDPQWLRPHEK